MVGTSLLEGLQDVQRESLWPDSIKTIGVKESSKKGGGGKVSKYLPNFGGDTGYQHIDFRQS